MSTHHFANITKSGLADNQIMQLDTIQIPVGLRDVEQQAELWKIPILHVELCPLVQKGLAQVAESVRNLSLKF